MLCKDADADADRTVPELLMGYNQYKGFLPKALFESGLYCCNMNAEDGKFWHPLGLQFDTWLREVVAGDCVFHRYYNIIVERRLAKDDPNAKKTDS
jgi:hypothetical protein